MSLESLNAKISLIRIYHLPNHFLSRTLTEHIKRVIFIFTLLVVWIMFPGKISCTSNIFISPWKRDFYYLDRVLFKKGNISLHSDVTNNPLFVDFCDTVDIF